MNGLETARRIGVTSPNVKILFLSANRDPDVVREALKTGAGFLAKADTAHDLLPLIRAIVRNEPFLRFRALGEDPSNPSEV